MPTLLFTNTMESIPDWVKVHVTSNIPPYGITARALLLDLIAGNWLVWN